MEKIKAINPSRIEWCCQEHGIAPEDLAGTLKIAMATIHKVMDGEDALSIRQLRKIADYFNRGILFFLEQSSVNKAKVYSGQFRTITNQKPDLTPKLKALIERVEKQRQVFVSLQEDLGYDVAKQWYPSNLNLNHNNPKQSATEVRRWLNLNNNSNLLDLRRAVENKGIMVFISNGYNGQWQIDKDDPVRGFSLYYNTFPIIAIKKQSTDGPQAFTLMHELAHLLLHKESIIDDEDDFYSYRGKEKTANEFAGCVLVPDQFLKLINLEYFSRIDVTEYDNYLENYCKQWCVSTEVILRRLLNENHLTSDLYQAYREWRKSLPIPIPSPGGSRINRFKEPVRVFGEPFVRTVFDALYSKHITLAKASTYLDNLKIKDVHRLEKANAHI